MKAVWGRYLALLGTAAAALSLVSLASANGSGADVSQIRIKNFGVVSDNLYRGAQPKHQDYKDLAALGIRTVLDLQAEGERGEQGEVEAAGMKFYRVGMSDKAWPTLGQVDAFFKIIDDPANQPVFMHCHGGHHRTGMMTAIYRVTRNNWDVGSACGEMDKYGFNTGLGHAKLKDFVRDYCSTRTATTQAAPAQVVTDGATRQP
jgi:protein tyrosine/serine phosphatase